MRSPEAAYDPVAKSPYVTVVLCPASVTAGSGLLWTLQADTGRYATSYTVRNADGRCLAANDQNGNDNWTYGDRIAKLGMAVCSDSPLQKWKAPADLTGQPLRDYREH